MNPRNRLWLTGSLLALSLALPVASGAAPAAKAEDVAGKQADLRELRSKIEDLRKDIARNEGSRNEVADQLKDAERSISRLQRELRELGDERGQLQASLADLERQTQTLETRIAQHRQRLEALLRHRHRHGDPGALRLLLGGEDPNLVSRDLYYLGAIARARGELLAEIGEMLRRKQALATSTGERAAALLAVEARQRERHTQLLDLRAQRQQTLAGISQKLASQKKAVADLRRDEQRMTQLVERLNRLIAERARAQREAARRAAERKAATPPRAGTAVENTRLPQAVAGGDFAGLRGKLRLPARGTLTNRFGSARAEGGTWRGLFIRGADGSEIRAIAPGSVVFAEWMRGFGNLLIIDHGSGYLSIYGYNDALLKNVGDTVGGGDVVATMGNSGGNAETGLYFEIRHQGQPVDPLKWASLK